MLTLESLQEMTDKEIADELLSLTPEDIEQFTLLKMLVDTGDYEIFLKTLMAYFANGRTWAREWAEIVNEKRHNFVKSTKPFTEQEVREQ